MTCAGSRAAELALRLKYAGVAPGRLTVIGDPVAALDHAVAATAAGDPDSRRLYVVPTYTAMLGLRAELTRRGLLSAFWEEAA
jgi:UDP-N-acetylmuramyl tripeptide synthase